MLKIERLVEDEDGFRSKMVLTYEGRTATITKSSRFNEVTEMQLSIFEVEHLYDMITLTHAAYKKQQEDQT